MPVLHVLQPTTFFGVASHRADIPSLLRLTHLVDKKYIGTSHPLHWWSRREGKDHARKEA
jgi:hypothetical protein